MGISIDYANVEGGEPRTGARFGLLTVAGSVAMFGGWCILDYVLVCFAPSRMNDFDWMLFLLPIAVGIAGFAAFRYRGLPTRVGLSVGAAALASLFAVLLVLLFGLQFHLLIGGHL